MRKYRYHNTMQRLGCDAAIVFLAFTLWRESCGYALRDFWPIRRPKQPSTANRHTGKGKITRVSFPVCRTWLRGKRLSTKICELEKVKQFSATYLLAAKVNCMCSRQQMAHDRWSPSARYAQDPTQGFSDAHVPRAHPQFQWLAKQHQRHANNCETHAAQPQQVTSLQQTTPT